MHSQLFRLQKSSFSLEKKFTEGLRGTERRKRELNFSA